MKTLDEKWQSVVERLEVESVAEGLLPSAAERAFGDWLAAVEPTIRGSLSSFAKHVDVESVLQESGLRMWLLAKGIAAGERPALEGTNASLRFMNRLARNVALNMIRKYRREVALDEDKVNNIRDVRSAHDVDPLFQTLLEECLKMLTKNPLKAINVRVESGHLSELEQARLAGMTKNTFHQNILRARRQLKECLASKGHPLESIA